MKQGKANRNPVHRGEIMVTDDVSDYPRMFGIFVLINTGHMPIDFRQMMEYNRLNDKDRIINNSPLHLEKA
jgi:hypothetical protein